MVTLCTSLFLEIDECQRKPHTNRMCMRGLICSGIAIESRYSFDCGRLCGSGLCSFELGSKLPAANIFFGSSSCLADL